MKCAGKKCDKGPGQLMLMLSGFTLILSAVVSLFKVELYLAGTQWILIAILLAIYANVFFLTHKECVSPEDKK